ncbi:hypothetical protein [Kitasatospora sp. CB01950]|uniref:hypothetical protein n=1 Tax=Kitasatospora sp. CB01950 TaxID=1703930 RepID=UPI00093F53C6|nr:hypothetical protein [Kitasatospora sp. CB01950]OKJ13865.1 hypothetical protein AMK19_10795 [Kitasatospora sp. CB01950]
MVHADFDRLVSSICSAPCASGVCAPLPGPRAAFRSAAVHVRLPPAWELAAGVVAALGLSGVPEGLLAGGVGACCPAFDAVAAGAGAFAAPASPASPESSGGQGEAECGHQAYGGGELTGAHDGSRSWSFGPAGGVGAVRSAGRARPGRTTSEPDGHSMDTPRSGGVYCGPLRPPTIFVRRAAPGRERNVMDDTGRGAVALAVALRDAHFRLKALVRGWEERLPGRGRQSLGPV